MSANFLLDHVKRTPELKIKLTHNELGERVSERSIKKIVMSWLKKKNFSPDQIKREFLCQRKGEDNSIEDLFADIVLLDPNSKEKKVSLIIECKRPKNYLTDTVFEQAREYAESKYGKSKNIWLTNGNDHWFLTKEGNEWKTTDKLNLLGVSFERNHDFPKFPISLKTKKFDDYLMEHHYEEIVEELEAPAKNTVKAFHNLLFSPKVITTEKSFSHKDLKLKFGYPSFMVFGTRISRYVGWYRKVFVKDSKGNEETMYIGINFNDGSKDKETLGALLCVGRLYKRVITHSLQLSLRQTNCPELKSEKHWRIAHNDFRGNKISDVIRAIKRRNAEHLIYKREGKNDKRVELGKLHHPKVCTWDNSKELLANIIHYGLARESLKKRL